MPVIITGNLFFQNLLPFSCHSIYNFFQAILSEILSKHTFVFEQIKRDLMFFWPCIMNWLYNNYQLWCTDYYLLIKYYSPLHVSSLKCSSLGGYNCTNAAYGTVTLYESSWWPVGTQLECVYRQVTRNSHREWQYILLHVYNCILLKMSTWG